MVQNLKVSIVDFKMEDQEKVSVLEKTTASYIRYIKHKIVSYTKYLNRRDVIKIINKRFMFM